MSKKLIFILFFIIGLIYFYPHFIYKLYGKSIPEKWNMSYDLITLGELESKIGPAQENISSKDYQNWIETYWWGTKQLRIIVVDCCSRDSTPRQVVFSVHVKGRYQPVHLEFLKS